MKTTGTRALVLSLVAALAFPLLATAGEIHKRQENQQDRIAAGIASGQLTPREAASLERKEARLNTEVRDFREDNGGKLTHGEYVKVNRQLNYLSHDIYRDRHNRYGKH